MEKNKWHHVISSHGFGYSKTLISDDTTEEGKQKAMGIFFSISDEENRCWKCGHEVVFHIKQGKLSWRCEHCGEEIIELSEEEIRKYYEKSKKEEG